MHFCFSCFHSLSLSSRHSQWIIHFDLATCSLLFTSLSHPLITLRYLTSVRIADSCHLTIQRVLSPLSRKSSFQAHCDSLAFSLSLCFSLNWCQFVVRLLIFSWLSSIWTVHKGTNWIWNFRISFILLLISALWLGDRVLLDRNSAHSDSSACITDEWLVTLASIHRLHHSLSHFFSHESWPCWIISSRQADRVCVDLPTNIFTLMYQSAQRRNLTHYKQFLLDIPNFRLQLLFYSRVLRITAAKGNMFHLMVFSSSKDRFSRTRSVHRQ